MNPNLTEVVIIADRSGSMRPLEEETISGINHLIKEQKEVPGECTFTLALFDDQYELVHDAVPIANVPTLTSEVYFARGWTALRDAVGRTIQTVGMRLSATPEKDRPSKVIFFVITDGEENRSQEYSQARISDIVKHQTDVYSWEFVFMGAGLEAWSQASHLGFAAASSINYSRDAGGSKALYHTLSRSVASARTGDAGALRSIQATYDKELTKCSKDSSKDG